MTLPATVRVFFAIDLPDPVKDTLGRYLSELKKKSKSTAIRWTPKNNLHITLQFLAEIKTEDLPDLKRNVTEQIHQLMVPGTFSFGSLLLFPSPFRPRVIVLSIIPEEGLAKIAASIGEGIKLTQYSTESRPFRGHLTLGRIKYPQDINLSFLGEVTIPSITPVPLSEVILFRSEPQAKGSLYTPLDRFLLKVC